MTTENIPSTQEARSTASAGCPNFELEPCADSRERSGLVGVGGVCHRCGQPLPPANSGFAFCPVCDVEEEPMITKIFRVALEWCQKNPAWKRICDIPNSDALYKTWDEMPKSFRAWWERKYPENPERAWREFGRGVCKVKYGFIGTDGVFYPEITDVPLNVNSCMVFRVGGGGAERQGEERCEQSRAASPSDEASRQEPRQ